MNTEKQFYKMTPEEKKQYWKDNYARNKAFNKEHRNVEVCRGKWNATYKKNKDTLLEKHPCECGGTFTLSHKVRHCESRKHIANCLKNQ